MQAKFCFEMHFFIESKELFSCFTKYLYSKLNCLLLPELIKKATEIDKISIYWFITTLNLDFLQERTDDHLTKQHFLNQNHLEFRIRCSTKCYSLTNVFPYLILSHIVLPVVFTVISEAPPFGLAVIKKNKRKEIHIQL